MLTKLKGIRQKISTSGAAAVTSAAVSGTRVRLAMTSAAGGYIGINETATVDMTYMPAGHVEYFSIPRNATISVIREGATDVVLVIDSIYN